MNFIFKIKGLTSFSQLGKDIKSLQERRMHARFSFFTRCLAENIQLTLKGGMIMTECRYL